MSEHTIGRLEYSSAGYGTKTGIVTDEYFIRRPGDDVAVAAEVIDPETGKPSEVNARRLVACWNACEGMTTKQLEDLPAPIRFQQQRLSDRTSERDELISALEEVLRISDREHDAWGRARAAIAAVKGTAEPIEIIELTAEQFDTFEKQVEDNPLAENGALQALLSRPKPWTNADARYASITKGGSYERLGAIRGAGSLKGLSGIAYRDTATGNLFVREPECFAARMKLIPDPTDAADGVVQ